MPASKRKAVSRSALSLTVLLVLMLAAVLQGQTGTRKELRIPDIPGYLTLKCDFHMHTVFSDGTVWPEVRVEEMWCEGYDAFAITDHIEYQPHAGDLPTNHNRSYELARPGAEELGLLIIRGSEITRQKPPGHFNALFLNDCSALAREDFKESMKAAYEQGAFIVWNHPGWPDDNETWYPIHTELYDEGLLNGIEVVNGDTYYPLAHRWCLEKKLTMFGNSDIHDPTAMEYDIAAGRHKPITLVFARARTLESIEEALRAQRTAVVWIDNLIGEEQYLKPLFDASVEIPDDLIELRGRSRYPVQIRNNSDLTFKLVLIEADGSVNVPSNLTLYPDSTVRLSIRAASADLTGEKGIEVRYRVANLLVAPDEGLPVTLKFKVRFTPAER